MRDDEAPHEPPVEDRCAHCDLADAKAAVGPGWHPLLDEAFAIAERAPFFVLAPYLRIGRRRAGLDVRVDSGCYATVEDWLRAQVALSRLLDRSRDICEACGRPAFRPAPRRSTRSHCSEHAMDWAAGIPEEVLWSAWDGWRNDADGWEPDPENHDWG